jgi:hypothetical protein
MASQEVLTALESLHRELEKLEPAIKHVEIAQQVIQTVKGIPQKHIALLKEVKDNDGKFKSELKDLFLKELVALTDENKKLQKNTSEIQQQVKAEQEALAKLKDTVQAFHERVEKINFPERLDKLDANVAGIMAAVQSVQSRLDIIERNVADRLKEIADRHKESHVSLQTKVEGLSKKQQILTYVTWGLILTIIVLFLITK